ncbi:MAG: hypothetical protein LC749_15365 [Actinobacteria bacterium]|nr:hypothetical protein [Actinomycetota bacterium]
MLQTQTCVSAQCGQCGTRWWDHWDFEPHWPTEAAALRWLAADGWQVHGSVLLCGRCTDVVACRTNGHVLPVA